MHQVKIYLNSGAVVAVVVKKFSVKKKTGGLSEAEWEGVGLYAPGLMHVNIDQIAAIVVRRVFIVTPWFVI